MSSGDQMSPDYDILSNLRRELAEKGQEADKFRKLYEDALDAGAAVVIQRDLARAAVEIEKDEVKKLRQRVEELEAKSKHFPAIVKQLGETSSTMVDLAAEEKRLTWELNRLMEVSQEEVADVERERDAERAKNQKLLERVAELVDALYVMRKFAAVSAEQGREPLKEACRRADAVLAKHDKEKP